jgi:hypothetical protein
MPIAPPAGGRAFLDIRAQPPDCHMADSRLLLLPSCGLRLTVHLCMHGETI